ADPLDESAPESTPHEDDREADDRAGLDERERFEELVERAESARQDDESAGVLDEHRLADEEVAELDAQVHVVVEAGLERQLDAQTHGHAVRLLRTAVAGLHDARPAPGDAGAAPGDDAARDVDGQGVLLRALGQARGPEERDGRPQLRQGAEPLDELRLDPQDPPRVRVHPVRAGVAVQQLLVGGPVRDLRTAQGDGALDAAARPHAARPVVLGSRKVRRARVAATTSAAGTCSSARWANSGSPGPKLTAGMPSALKRATSVHPSLGATAPPTACAISAAIGRSRPGRAPSDRSTTRRSWPGNRPRRCSSAWRPVI